jgi:hypothetical protein
MGEGGQKVPKGVTNYMNGLLFEIPLHRHHFRFFSSLVENNVHLLQLSVRVESICHSQNEILTSRTFIFHFFISFGTVHKLRHYFLCQYK